MSVDLELYLQISLTLFIIIDPIGYSLLFFSLTKDYEKEIKNKIAILSVFYSSIILLSYLFLGNILLGLIHVEIGAMKITGGLALFKTAHTIVYGDKNDYENVNGLENPFKIAIYPLSTGILAGPGTLTTIIILSHEFTEIYEYLTMILGILTILFLSLVFSLLTDYLNRIDKNILDILNITIGILLSSLSVTFIINGVKMFFF
jgi:multiple antibiotic resistance protein